jgi:hypothetical protein
MDLILTWWGVRIFCRLGQNFRQLLPPPPFRHGFYDAALEHKGQKCQHRLHLEVL